MSFQGLISICIIIIKYTQYLFFILYYKLAVIVWHFIAGQNYLK